jgi:putative ABC transport system substrate-binding protein
MDGHGIGSSTSPAAHFDRRLLLAGLGLAAVTLPRAGAAQSPARIPTVAVLSTVSAGFAAPYLATGREALHELGYTEGRNILVELRFADFRGLDRLLELATELVALKPDVIVVVGDRAVEAAKRATSTIPIVMVSAGDPVRSGFVASVARPAGNITGLSSLLPELNVKQVELLKEALPDASRIAVLWNPKSSGGVLGMNAIAAAAPQLGIAVRSLEVVTPDEFAPAFAKMAEDGTKALVVLTDPLTFSRRRDILALAERHRLPGIFEVREFVDDGGVMSYGPSLREMMRRAPVFIDKILKGAKPADLPVEQPTKFELVVNLKAARAIGLTIAPSVVAQAADVIE